VPIPKEHAASGNAIESAIQKALKEAEDKNIIGNAITPFMLDRVKVLTGRSSLEASILQI
jgi:pseudouridine-5'-phosphate glycosidase